MSPEQARQELIEQFRTGSFQKIVAAIDALFDAKLAERKPEVWGSSSMTNAPEWPICPTCDKPIYFGHECGKPGHTPEAA